ncbi:MAG: DMT family transporter [Alphaproteobacteria bacterium]|nr:DMT family transporter [Alphaproteobacteria bacterium]
MPIRTEPRHATLLVCGAAFLWSLGGLFVRLMGDLDGWTIAFWRAAFMVLAVGGWLLATHGRRAFTLYRDMGWAGLLSGLLLAVAFVTFILAVSHTTVANAVVLQSASPLVAALLARLFLKEPISPPTALTISIAMAGVALMFADALGGGEILGNLLAFGVALSFGAYIVVVRAGRRLDLLPSAVLAGLFAMAATLPFANLAGPSGSEFAILAAMGTVQLGLGLYLFMRGAPHLSAAFVGLLGLLETVLAPFWVWLVFREIPSALALAGGAIVLTALLVHSALGLRRVTAA